MARRLTQVLLIASTLGFSWLAMMVVHELGHAMHLWLSGGSVERVVLHPWALSQTLAKTNPHPFWVALGGPLWGSLLPLAGYWIVGRTAPSRAYLAALLAGFCLVANGAYLAGDALVRGGDGRELIVHGAPPWALPLVGLPMVAAGLWLWHGLGPRFGLGPGAGRVDRRDAVGMAVALAALVSIEILLAA